MKKRREKNVCRLDMIYHWSIEGRRWGMEKKTEMVFFLLRRLHRYFFVALPLHYGPEQKKKHIQNSRLINYFPMSEGKSKVSEVSKRANK